MKHFAAIQSEFLKEARNWDDLTIEEQREYLKRHPGSKRTLTAKPVVHKYDVNKKEISINDLTNVNRIHRKQALRQFALGEAYLNFKGKKYYSSGIISGKDLKKGMTVLSVYDDYNTGVDFDKIMGVTGNDTQYGKSGVKYDSVKDALAANNVTSLKELEDKDSLNTYGYHHYLQIADLDNNEEGPFYYLHNGRWCRGSGAEKISFVELKEVDENNKVDDPTNWSDDKVKGFLSKKLDTINDKSFENVLRTALFDNKTVINWETIKTKISEQFPELQ